IASQPKWVTRKPPRVGPMAAPPLIRMACAPMAAPRFPSGNVSVMMARTLVVIRPLFHQSVRLHLIHDDRDVALGETSPAADPAHAHAGFPPNLAKNDDLGQGKPRGLTPSGHMLLE